eukprot:NODE_2392_length_1189_cov_37.731638_g2278_i0.p1 GENE.NODE_2392_length_1189_cov_37.731638_g2278_i0~~NODE_2392_length_1189_cov_37.731638_g2278_i0.p1  ORF type:complete len:348 (-),score=86.42 NODE_2392_length_1189_cov_37.731638_g2278_i0:91-1134(-)
MSVMDAAAILSICKAKDRDGMYRTPELNDKLYLHFKGFTTIGGLEHYTAVRVLWLEGNAISKIENLDHQSELRTLYLHQNCLYELDNLAPLQQLDSLNVSENFISTLTNLACLPKLQTLLMKDNRLRTYADVAHLLDCPFIRVLDLSNNQLEDPEIMFVFAQMPELTILKLEGNPVIKKIPHYRKATIASIPKLRHLDDRPVFDDERRLCMAWARGGLEAEREERALMRTEEEDKRVANWKAFDEMIALARSQRADGDEPEHTNYHMRNHMEPTQSSEGVSPIESEEDEYLDRILDQPSLPGVEAPPLQTEETDELEDLETVDLCNTVRATDDGPRKHAWGEDPSVL